MELLLTHHDTLPDDTFSLEQPNTPAVRAAGHGGQRPPVAEDHGGRGAAHHKLWMQVTLSLEQASTTCCACCRTWGATTSRSRRSGRPWSCPSPTTSCTSRSGSTPPGGVLLWGPPGTGKTMLAKAVAHHTTAAFIRVVGSEFVQKYLGEVRAADGRLGSPLLDAGARARRVAVTGGYSAPPPLPPG